MEGEKLKQDLVLPSASASTSWEVVEKHEGAVVSPTPSFLLFQ